MSPLPLAEFGFPGPLRDSLVRAILDGSKTSTSSLARQYQVAGDALPRVGECSAVLDSDQHVVCVIEVVGVDVVALGSVNVAHAVAEGEGFESVAQWRAAHEAFWRSPELMEELGPDFALDDATPVVLESFRVTHRF